MIGLESAFGACMGLVHRGELSFARLLTAMTLEEDLLEPNRTIMKDFALQAVEEGCADVVQVNGITLIDKDAAWVVNPEKFYSKSRNCPFAGWSLQGKPLYTIANSPLAADWQMVMAEGEVLF